MGFSFWQCELDPCNDLHLGPSCLFGLRVQNAYQDVRLFIFHVRVKSDSFLRAVVGPLECSVLESVFNQLVKADLDRSNELPFLI